jgi:hypothetical protein
VAIAASGGPGWTDILTAVGTVGAVIAAVGIALWSERRSDRRLREEHRRTDLMLAQQREREKAAVEDERAHGRAQIDEERRLALDREQRTEAYRVQVVPAYKSVGGAPDGYGDPGGSVRRLAAMVVNHGNYTITRVRAHFVFSERTGPVEPQRSEYLPGFADLPRALRGEWAASPAYAMQDVLTPRGTAIRFESAPVPDRALEDPYPVVCWTDRWGTRWEHMRGEVRQIPDNETPTREAH